MSRNTKASAGAPEAEPEAREARLAKSAYAIREKPKRASRPKASTGRKAKPSRKARLRRRAMISKAAQPKSRPRNRNRPGRVQKASPINKDWNRKKTLNLLAMPGPFGTSAEASGEPEGRPVPAAAGSARAAPLSANPPARKAA